MRSTFIGANQMTPRRKDPAGKHLRLHNQARSPDQEAKIMTRLKAKEEKRRQKLKDLGIDYDFEGYAEKAKPKPKHTTFED
ncbi:MAG TPA: hypothetical protein V6D20_07675 [Candidatus Obscuribacterales bacterium]